MSASSSHYPRPQSVANAIGQPVSFSKGPLAGQTVRLELEEIQKADLGRKYARKDKRPLDPPPVVICRLYTTCSAGPGRGVYEREADPDLAAFDAVCHIDLFPVPQEYDAYTHGHTEPVQSASHQAGQPAGVRADAPLTYVPLHAPGPSTLRPGTEIPTPWTPPPSAYLPSMTMPTPSMPFGQASLGRAVPPTLPGLQSVTQGFMVHPRYAPPADPAAATEDPDIVAHLGPYVIRESSKCTRMLSGTTFVQAAVVDYNGRKTAMFVFSDIAVKTEGTFVLRYRALNLFSQGDMPYPARMLAECYSGPFKVYSTKEFPGLRASTDLTKRLARYGVRVNVRENERKRRKRSEMVADGDDAPDPDSLADAGGRELSDVDEFSSPTTSTGSPKMALNLVRLRPHP